jgi:hypothetical protein
MKFVSLLSALVVLAPSLADAAPSVSCKTEANGRWVITSYSFDDGIVAVSDAEARKNVGSKVFISKDKVAYLNETCDVAKVSSMKSNDYQKYPLGVDIDCKNKVFLPAFFVANSCEKMLAVSGDGVNYTLRRQ